MTKLAYNVPELAQATGLTKTQVYRLLENRELAGRKVGTRWIIPAENVDAFLRSRGHVSTAHRPCV
jgi:excisionase family DNA binding protein